MIISADNTAVGGSSNNMSSVTFRYTDARYNFDLYEAISGKLYTKALGYTTIGKIEGENLEAGVSGAHAVTVTAKNGYYLYRLLAQDSNMYTSLGQNGTITISSAHVLSSETLIATKEPLAVVPS